MRIYDKKGQSALEYAIIVAVVVGALLAMQIYVKRAVSGRLRSSTDSIGDQYSAGLTTSTIVNTQSGIDETTEYVNTGAYADTRATHTDVTQAAQNIRTTDAAYLGAQEQINTAFTNEAVLPADPASLPELFDE